MKRGRSVLPARMGHFGVFGGRFVPETLIPALEELEREYRAARRDPEFRKELERLLRVYAGRPTPLFHAARISKNLGVKIYLKREDLCHTGAHKINNTLGQALLAGRMGKKRVIAETGAGQHGVATATAAALLGLECDVYMGEEDVRRQALNVFRMSLLGARVIPVTQGTRTLKDAVNETLRDWVTHVKTTHYILGSVVGPHPFPTIVRDFQSVIGREARAQILKAEGRLPDCLVACVGGGSNSLGLFHPFLRDTRVKMIGVEAGGLGIRTFHHGASLLTGTPGVLHGSMSLILQTRDGQIRPAHSVSAGLDYPGVGPELSHLRTTGRISVAAVTDSEALEGFHYLSRMEGIIPALEPSHALGYLRKYGRKMKRGAVVILNLSGRGDKDIDIVRNYGTDPGSL